METNRDLIRQGLKLLGPERVRRAVDYNTFEVVRLNDGKPVLKGSESYCHCFIGEACLDLDHFGRASVIWTHFGLRYMWMDIDPLLAISKAHANGDPTLQEEVMIFLAENGNAEQPQPQLEASLQCQNS